MKHWEGKSLPQISGKTFLTLLTWESIWKVYS